MPLVGGALALILFGLVLFGRILSHALLRWDDATHILENPYLHDPLTFGKFLDLWRHPYFGLYIPMTYTVWGIVKVWTTDPAVFHAVNIVFHLLNTLLVLRIFSQIGMSLSAGFLGATFFLVHPFTVEPVAWISGFKDVGATFWGLLAISVFLSRLRPLAVRSALACLFYAFSVMSKPSGLVFAVIAGLLSCFRRERDDGETDDVKHGSVDQTLRLPSDLACGKNGLGARRKLMEHPMAHAVLGTILALPVIYIAMELQPARHIAEQVHWSKRPIIALDAIAFYAQKLVWPVGLLPDYARVPSLVLSGEWRWKVGLALGLVLGVGWIFWKSPKRSLGPLIMLIALSPNLGMLSFAFQDHSTVADRYAYTALVGAAITVGSLASYRWWMKCVIGGVLPLLSWLSFVQMGYWKDQRVLFNYVLSINPVSFVALDGLGVEAFRRGDLAQAENFFRQALAVNPTNAKVWFNLGSALWVKGVQKAGTDALETSLKLDPNHPDTLNNLGFVYASVGLSEAAESLYRRALWVNPLDVDTRYNLARLLNQKGAHAEASALMDEAFKINPAFAAKVKR